MPSKITREELIALCERGVVPVNRWRNRDTSAAQMQLGQALALLKAECEFYPNTEECNADTWYFWIEYPGFGFFEYGGKEMESELFYIPTSARLDRATGGDWY